MSPLQQPLKLCYVRWFDACIYPEGNVETDDVTGPCQMASCGVLVKREATFISVGLEYNLDNNNYRLVQTIPMVNVINFQVWDATPSPAV